MSTGAAGDGLLRGMFEGCISGGDMGIQRRPYHKNCKCAMHKSRAGNCTHSSRYNNVSYPIRRSWSEGCLALMNPSTPPAAATPPSPSSPRVGEITRTHTQLVLWREEDEERDHIHPVSFSSKV